jgi:hypothetical protein
MAVGNLPPVGSQYGPCAEPCVHLDCAATRECAAAPCRICSEPIGYETGFFQESEPQLRPRIYVHAMCAFDEVEKERARTPVGG